MVFLGWVSVSATEHEEVEEVFSGEALPVSKDTFSILSWNIGYAGLGDAMDFFYDGGKGVRPSESYHEKCLSGIKRSLSIHGQSDILLLQETDTLAKRSWYKPLHKKLMETAPAYIAFYAQNYDVAFVPLPLSEPMGRVHSGLFSLSRYQAEEVLRYALPGDYSWPYSLFMPNRCILLIRYNLTRSRDLVVVNLHNSAFDEGGGQRLKQLEFIHDLAVKEFKKGNYVILGGDWNLNPPGWSPEMISNGDKAVQVNPSFPDTLFEEWTFAYDAGLPTNRSLYQPYMKGRTTTTLLDFFLVSPNIEVIGVKTFDLAFRHSDHQPVRIEVVLK